MPVEEHTPDKKDPQEGPHHRKQAWTDRIDDAIARARRLSQRLREIEAELVDIRKELSETGEDESQAGA